jgi:hypothetical protein
MAVWGAQHLLARSVSRAALKGSLGKAGVGVADSGQPNFLFPPSAIPTPSLLAAAVTFDMPRRPTQSPSAVF